MSRLLHAAEHAGTGRCDGTTAKAFRSVRDRGAGNFPQPAGLSGKRKGKPLSAFIQTF